MAMPLTRAQALENRAFLKSLRKMGNVRLACRELGLKYGTMQHRRRQHPAFALRWDAALAFARASFDKLRMNGRGGPSTGSGRAGKMGPRVRGNDERASFKTVGGEMTICRRNDGKLQIKQFAFNVSKQGPRGVDRM